MPRLLLGAFVALLLSTAAVAQSNEDLRRVVLINGDVYVGTVADESADPIVVTTTDGIERRFPRSQVDFVGPLINGRFFRTDPVQTRLFVAPTARTLGGGEFRGDLTYFYPSITAGVSDNVDLLATGFLSFGTGDGDSGLITPLIGLKARIYKSESVQVAVGTSAIFLLGGDDGAAGALPYAVATFGDETRAFSVGVGGLVGAVGGELDVANGLLYGLGGETQVNNGVKLFIEALGIVGTGDSNDFDTGLLVLPGVRFFGDKFAFDVIGFVATDFERLYGFAPVGARASYAF